MIAFLLLAVPLFAQSDAVQKQLEAGRIQRESVRKQAEAAAKYRAPLPSLQPAADCDPLPVTEIAPIIDGAAQENGVDSALLRGVIDQESGGRPCALSDLVGAPG